MTNYNRFTGSQIRYLIWIYRLTQSGCGVRNVELAAALCLSRASVHAMLKSLSTQGVVQRETFGLAHLTDEGRALAQEYAGCCAVLERSLSELCGSGAVSEDALCALLADLPPERLDALYRRFYRSVPSSKRCMTSNSS